jgi:chromosome segregation ATPase
VLRDASIERLSQETGGLQNKLVSVSQQLSRVTEATEDKISLLEKSISELRDKVTCMEADAKMADETVKILRENEVQIAQRLKLANDEGERAKIKLQESSNAKITELQADLDAALRSTVSLTDQLKVSTHSKYLSEKVKADLELECRDLHKRVASLTKLRDDIDTLEDEMEFATFAKSHVEDKLNFAIFDLDRTSRLLNLRDDDLADQDEIIARISGEKEMLQKHVATISKQLEAKDFKLHLNMKIQAGIECERGALISREESLKAIIEALEGEKDASEKEDAALREQSNANPSSASSPSENSSPWGSSPIKSIDEALRDTAFGADDTFDESMFLPNVDVETDIPQTGNISTPPKTPTEEELVLSSPRSRERSAHKAQTPAKRLTRAMRNKLRTPLGKSAVQNTPLSTSMSTKKFTRASSRKKHTKI